MNLDRKISVVLKYLMMGGEIEIQGKTYVWLKNEVVNQTEENLFIIDGLAIKAQSFSGADDTEGKVHYIGQGDIPLSQFINLIHSIKERTLEEIVMNTALTEFKQSNG